MNFALYQGVFDKNMRPSARKLKFNWKLIFQQDNDLKHITKSTRELLKKKK